ncbi:MAG: ABC transporter ATP-binding protein [Actinomycetota bacterium]|nr:ABC transporter ATP-binding protein [Actinomycetota bacterium]
MTRVYRTSSEAVEALIDVNADFRPGELSVIVGPSGSGKSTLLRILAAIDRPTSGSVLIHGRDLAQLGRGARRRIRRLDIGYVHQDPAANLFPYMTIAEHIRFGAQVRGADHLEGVPDLMDRFSLVNLSDRFPAQLSSGQQQLAAMASAVSGSPAVVIADEPTAELDDSSSVAVLDGLRSMRTLGTCVIVATHDQAMLDVADRVLRVRHGRLEGQR